MRFFILLLTLLFAQVFSQISWGFSFESRAEAVHCAATAAYFEDRQHGEDGMEYIIWVIMNRYNDVDNRWPNTICGVVYEPSRTDDPYQCAFSFACDKKKDVVRRQDLFDTALWITNNVFSGAIHLDPTFGAQYYYKCELHGTRGWMSGLVMTTRVGAHCFFKSYK